MKKTITIEFTKEEQEDLIIKTILKPILFSMRDIGVITSQQCRSEYKKYRRHKCNIKETIDFICNHTPTYTCEKVLRATIDNQINEIIKNQIRFMTTTWI